jgi:hypothetical protein
MNLGLMLLAMSFFLPLEGIIILPFKFLLKAMITSTQWIEHLPFSVWRDIHITPAHFILLLVIVILSIESVILKKKHIIFALLVGITILNFIDLVTAYRQYKNQKLTIYAVQNRAAIELQKGNAAVLLGDEKLLKDEKKLKFHIRPNQIANRLKKILAHPVEIDTSASGFTVSGPFAEIDGRRFVFYRQAADSIYLNYKADFLLVYPKASPPKKSAFNMQPILLAGQSQKNIDKWMAVRPNAYVLQESGAFVTEY